VQPLRAKFLVKQIPAFDVFWPQEDFLHVVRLSLEHDTAGCGGAFEVRLVARRVLIKTDLTESETARDGR
jgi:hypothetical protein